MVINQIESTGKFNIFLLSFFIHVIHFLFVLTLILFLYYLLDSFNESENNCRAIVIYDTHKCSSQLSNQSKDRILATKYTAIVPYKEADSLTQSPWENDQIVYVTEDNNSSIFRLPGESVPDASKRCFAPFQIFDSFEKLKSKVDVFSIEWGFQATCYDYHIHCNQFGS